MPFCTVCGTPYNEQTKFCTGCGTLLKPAATTNPVQKDVLITNESTAAIPAQQSVPVVARSPFNVGRWIKKNKIWLIILMLAALAFASYQILFGSSPGKDGTAAGIMECNCSEKRNAVWQAATQRFITASANRQFLSENEIMACADSMASQVQMAYDSCIGEARNEYATAYKKLTGKQPDEFIVAYTKSVAGCQNADSNFQTAFAEGRKQILSTFQKRVGLPNIPPPVETAKETNDSKEDEVAMNDHPAREPEQVEDTITTNGAVDFRQQIIRLITAENSIRTTSDIEKVLDLYSFPMYRNFKLSDVTRERLYKVYDYSYLKRWRYHKIYNYENKIKVTPLNDGRIRVDASFQFETGVDPNGTSSKIQQVSNAYIFNAAGKIVSVGVSTDGNL